jgi:hypothetical protein
MAPRPLRLRAPVAFTIGAGQTGAEMTNSDPDRSSPTVEPLEPDMDGVAAAPPQQSARRRKTPPQSRVEAQLRWRVAEVEARLAEVTRCLEAAENAAAVRAETIRVWERKFDAIATSKSWRMTGFLRSGARRIRGLFRR